MEIQQFEQILLRTALCSMASDGRIDDREIALIHVLIKDLSLNNNSDLSEIISGFINELKLNPPTFISRYFSFLKSVELSKNQELSLIDFIIKMIKADDIIEYSEIKFFKVIRCCLKVSDAEILAVCPGIEQFLENDINLEFNLEKLTAQYFEVFPQNNFKIVSIDSFKL